MFRSGHSSVERGAPVSVLERKSEALIRSRSRSANIRLLKRAFDIVVAAALLVFLAPAFIIVSLACLISDWGPVFYVHERIGQRGKPFGCFKFRTMRLDAAQALAELLRTDEQARKEWHASHKLKRDPRVTPIGRILRKTSLDELPQLINVLLGQMSLVGPRPVVLVELEQHYRGLAREAYVSVKPGITGPWQVSGRSDVDYARRVSLDCEYVNQISVRKDIVLLAKTALIVVRRNGAY